jgi:uncharacterized membrane protein HdeD (DUF308 family)
MAATTAEGMAVPGEAAGRGVPWWLVLLEGIAALILGVLLLADPAATTVVVVRLLGVYFLIDGVFRIVTIFIDRHGWGWKLAGGILGILAGLAVLQHPLWSTILVPAVTAATVGIFGMIMGVFALIQAFQGSGWGAGILGVLGILFGLVLLLNPLTAAVGLVWAVGFLAIAGGISLMVAAFRSR